MNQKTQSENKTQGFGVRHLTVEENADGQRIDNYLRKLLPGIPKSKLYKIIRKGEVRLNKKRVKPESKIKAGDILRVPPITINEKQDVFIPPKVQNLIKDAVLYEDKNFLIIDKPAGIAVHSGTKNSFGIIDIVAKAFPNQGWELCHRLDKDTSGCLVFANSRDGLKEFQYLSKTNKIHKQYLVLVKGSWQANDFTVDAPIEKQQDSSKNNFFERVEQGGEKEAITVFTTFETYKKTTLMQAILKTGRTHQIRVHCALSKYPVAMDDKYGDFRWNRALKQRGLNRIFLHSHIIKFKAFDETIHISANLPKDLQEFIDKNG